MSQESISEFDNRPEPICITEIQAITDEKIQKQNNYIPTYVHEKQNGQTNDKRRRNSEEVNKFIPQS